ncbi:MAG: thiolase family protein [Candidatus Eremiobacteraeota bacterium]|nr:thiolase family protein [Candidatus Eremiobacteraeota bacterium]MBV8339019.1 thiolase family protein [Candidatus Eremiobacteraeota bacterium]MBV8460698.1 thiolase family protein [Candidatus Eremiobacteraeota bacterium]MBV8669578.1 thiolase family protein [Candidatus Eremiobacteraeota bacterium]MBV8670123.1 thiolase family protein [Candidatus Eremiobacteraeota bacterium]
MRDVVIVAAARTPIGKYAGALRHVRPDDLSAVVLRALAERAKVDPADVEDVLWGCSNQAGEDNRNVARMALLAADFPEHVAGATLNRLCGSGLQAINSAAHAIAADCGDVFIAGGVESMTRAPYVMPKPEAEFARGPQLFDTTLGARMYNPKLTARGYPPLSMGETAENVAERYKISRTEQDEFAYASQHKTGDAQRAGAFDRELVGVSVPANGKTSAAVVIARDEHPRPDVTMEQLAKLKPAFREGGTVTAGNASGINDGAAGIVLMSAEEAKRRGLQPLARIVTSAVAGVDPNVMGLGPIPASQKALARAELRIDDIDLIELNEAFASQSLACIRELEIPMERVNVHGGAIALGHPLGCSGARIMVTLLHAMDARGAKRGMATMCIGVGQGITTIVER